MQIRKRLFYWSRTDSRTESAQICMFIALKLVSLSISFFLSSFLPPSLQCNDAVDDNNLLLLAGELLQRKALFTVLSVPLPVEQRICSPLESIAAMTQLKAKSVSGAFRCPPTWHRRSEKASKMATITARVWPVGFLFVVFFFAKVDRPFQLISLESLDAGIGRFEYDRISRNSVRLLRDCLFVRPSVCAGDRFLGTFPLPSLQRSNCDRIDRTERSDQRAFAVLFDQPNLFPSLFSKLCFALLKSVVWAVAGKAPSICICGLDFRVCVCVCMCVRLAASQFELSAHARLFGTFAFRSPEVVWSAQNRSPSSSSIINYSCITFTRRL